MSPSAGGSTSLAAGQKRKADSVGKGTASGSRKRQKAQNARAIHVQPADAALSAAGDLNVAAFTKAREFEIKALDRSMQTSKKGLMTRAFQQVPRHMRRRTASHNVKKVPRRLRRRAEREMREDNTTTVTARRRTPSRRLRLRLELAKSAKKFNERSKILRQRRREAQAKAQEANRKNRLSISRLPRVKRNTLANPPLATSKFKKRQLHKTWLPTHLWHAKRAHMTKTGEPLWRMTLPISPTEKSYRPTHRAGGSRGCIAWDMSYMSTVACQGTEASLQNMLKALGFHGECWSGPKYKRWIRGTRSAEGWVRERDNDKRPISPVTVIWCVEPTSEKSNVVTNSGGKKPLQRKLWIRVHPSAFHQFWLKLLQVARLQRPQILLEDLRFEIGSIEITGPGSTEALLGVLRPIDTENMPAESAAKIWPSLAGLHNPAVLPQSVLMAFNVMDPRLNHPPKQIAIPKGDAATSALTNLAVTWPPDTTTLASDIFSHKKRYTATKAMPSQKSISRRKVLLGSHEILQLTEKDARIPALLLATRPPKHSSKSQGSWDLLLPWKRVDAVWRSLMYYPLSSGSTSRFGGLDEKRQLEFERGQPWFPGDFPGTEAGQAWERTESERRFDEWIRRPASSRIAWEKVILGNGKRGEHGLGWTCDWEFLINTGAKQEGEIVDEVADDNNMHNDEPPPPPAPTKEPLTQRQRKAAKAKAAKAKAAKAKAATEANNRRRNTSSPESESEPSDPSALNSDLTPTPKFQHATPSQALLLFASRPPSSTTATTLPAIPVLATIRLALLTRGTPLPAARIYRLPSDPALRRQWLQLDPSTHQQSTPRFKKHPPKPQKTLPPDPPTFTYLPPNAHPDVVLQHGHPHPGSSLSAEERDDLLKQLMFPGMTVQERETHPACPGTGDLVGYITTGAYNLSDGAGGAVGAVWLQKVLTAWEGEEVGARERHLCIVRNAGESVGRLAVWQVCT